MFLGQSSKKKSPYFEFYISLEDREERIVSWNVDDQTLLAGKLHMGVNVTGLSRSDQGYTFVRESHIMDKRPNFPFIQHIAQPTSLDEALKMPMFSRSTLDVLVVKVHQGGISYEGLPYKTADVKDQSVNSTREITVYGNLTDVIAENKVYRMTYMTLSKFNGARVFKSSDRSAISPSDTDIAAPMVVTSTFSGTVHSIVMSSLNIFYKCPHCDDTLDGDGSSAWCENCDVGLSTNAIIKVDELRFTVRNHNNVLRNFKCRHHIVEDMTGQKVKDKKLFFHKFIDTKVMVTFDQSSGDVVTIEETFI